jgi:cathepsin A (carboxypeptidase C)
MWDRLVRTLADIASKKIGHYLNLPDVRRTLGVDKAHGPWSSCDNLVGQNFHASLDQIGKTWLYVSNLLERGVRVLNYAGEYSILLIIPMSCC